MEVKAFYACHSKNDHVPASEPVHLDRDTAVSVAMQVLRDPHDFIGFVDEAGETIQFYYDECGEIWMEFPCPSEGGSYGRHISLEEVEAAVRDLPTRFTKTSIANSRFEKW